MEFDASPPHRPHTARRIKEFVIFPVVFGSAVLVTISPCVAWRWDLPRHWMLARAAVARQENRSAPVGASAFEVGDGAGKPAQRDAVDHRTAISFSGDLYQRRFPGSACTLPASMQLLYHSDYAEYFLQLVRGPPFAALRLSDGEWLCAAGKLKGDSNGGPTTDLCVSNKSVPFRSHFAHFENDSSTFRFLNVNWLCKEKTRIHRIADKIISALPIEHRPVFIPYAYSDKLRFNDRVFRQFVNELRGRCVFVGPRHVRAFPREFLNCSAVIEVPRRNQVWAAHRAIYNEIAKAVELLPLQKGFILIAAGIASKPMVSELSAGRAVPRVGLRKGHSILDVGTMFDVFAGISKKGPIPRNDDRVIAMCKRYPEFMAAGLCDSESLRR